MTPRPQGLANGPWQTTGTDRTAGLGQHAPADNRPPPTSGQGAISLVSCQFAGRGPRRGARGLPRPLGYLYRQPQSPRDGRQRTVGASRWQCFQEAHGGLFLVCPPSVGKWEGSWLQCSSSDRCRGWRWRLCRPGTKCRGATVCRAPSKERWTKIQWPRGV